jgi:hypothetical protein
MRKDTNPVDALRDAVQRRQQHDQGAAQARADIDRHLLAILKADPDIDRDDLAELADVSPTKVRQIAKEGGIPPRKRGGRGRRVVKPTE